MNVLKKESETSKVSQMRFSNLGNRNNKNEENEQSLRETWDTIKQTNIRIIEIAGEERKKQKEYEHKYN